jgi:cation diffusion facilitator CzcD-associated flavoprotein CzcO
MCKVAIIGAGPYGLSLAAHLYERKIEHRIFGRPMQFWSQIAAAAGERYLKSYCFGTNLSAPAPGFSFADYNTPRNLETFEPCSMANFAEYGRWFQETKVPWVEPVDVLNVQQRDGGFAISLSNGESFVAQQVVVATGLSNFAHVPSVLGTVSSSLVSHTADIAKFAAFAGRSVAVLGAGQSALEACALLREAGAHPTLLVREKTIRWHSRVSLKRSLWKKLRSPISGLGTGPKAWALTRFPGAMHRIPSKLRTSFVKSHLPAEGAWWLRERFEERVPVHLHSEVVGASECCGHVALMVRNSKDNTTAKMTFDHVIAGSGYTIDVDRIRFLDPALREKVDRIDRYPRLNASFESSVPGLRFVGAASAMSFGPLFRFVVGADYTARTIARHTAMQYASLG